MPSRPHVYGSVVDDQTRCAHYRTLHDVVAIRFACCLRYYPCFQCHAESESHPARQWPQSEWSEHAILCGVCGNEMSVLTYRAVTECPTCATEFNAGCRSHAHLYFAVPAPA